MPFRLYATFIKIQSKLNMLFSGQGLIWGGGGGFGTKGQVTQKSTVRSGRNSHLYEILCLSRLSASFIKFQLKLSRQVTPKSIVRSGRNSNLFEILCMSRLSASLKKIQLKLKRLCSGQSQIWCFSALKVKRPIWEDFELIRDFTAVLVTCKIEHDSIKSEGSILLTIFSPL